MEWITDEHRRNFVTEGYMVIRSVIPAEVAANAVRDICEFLGADLSDCGTWYKGDPQLDGLVPLHHAQSLWDIRQHSNLHQVFTEFFGTPRLMVDINRCMFRPPVHPRFPTISHSNIHWDTDPRTGGPGSLQSLVLLTDVKRNGGGYQCLPEIYRNLQAWLETNACGSDFDFFNPGLTNRETTQIEGQAGDLILWSTKLPHGTATNTSRHPRIAAFVAMEPPPDDPQLRASMKSWWQTKRAPDYWRGLKGQLDPEPGAPAVLTELGQKLIGALPW